MLHVLVGAACNNNCIFCMESDRAGRRSHVARQSRADLERMITAYPHRDEILFTSGEPTLNADLPALIAWARKAGFRTIGLISNGRMLAYPGLVRRLVDCGLTKATVSIHGHSPRLHDGLVRVKGAFAQTLAGLRHLRDPGLPRRLELHTSTVLVRRNLPQLSQIHQLLSDLGVDRMCFNVMMLKGRGAQHQDLLMARYGDIARAFGNLLAGLDRTEARRVTLADIPRCAVSGLGVEVVGDQERFEQFEFLGSNGIARMSAEELEALRRSAPDRAAVVRVLQQRVDGGAALSGDDRYYLTSREVKDNILRIKRAECALCACVDRCPGVWEAYVAAHGWDEFEPVAKDDQRPPTDAKTTGKAIG